MPAAEKEPRPGRSAVAPIVSGSRQKKCSSGERKSDNYCCEAPAPDFAVVLRDKPARGIGCAHCGGGNRMPYLRKIFLALLSVSFGATGSGQRTAGSSASDKVWSGEIRVTCRGVMPARLRLALRPCLNSPIQE